MRQELEAVLNAMRQMPTEELPVLIGELESVKAAAWAKMTAPVYIASHDELLDVNKAAERLGMSADYLYRHSRTLPFTHRMGRKLLFSSVGIDQFIKRGKR